MGCPDGLTMTGEDHVFDNIFVLEVEEEEEEESSIGGVGLDDVVGVLDDDVII